MDFYSAPAQCQQLSAGRHVAPFDWTHLRDSELTSILFCTLMIQVQQIPIVVFAIVWPEPMGLEHLRALHWCLLAAHNTLHFVHVLQRTALCPHIPWPTVHKCREVHVWKIQGFCSGALWCFIRTKILPLLWGITPSESSSWNTIFSLCRCKNCDL
jgi:hypothetical protein